MYWNSTAYVPNAVLFNLAEDSERPVVVAVIAVAMVEPTIHKVIIMIAVRHALVPTVIVPALAVHRLAVVSVLGTHRNRMLIVVSLVRVVQMPIVQIVYMVAVLNTSVPTVLAMHMRMRFVCCASHSL